MQESSCVYNAHASDKVPDGVFMGLWVNLESTCLCFSFVQIPALYQYCHSVKFSKSDFHTYRTSAVQGVLLHHCSHLFVRIKLAY